MKLEVLESFMTTGRRTPSRFMLKKPNPYLMGKLAPMQTLHLQCVCVWERESKGTHQFSVTLSFAPKCSSDRTFSLFSEKVVWWVLRCETRSNRESMRPLWFSHLYILSSATIYIYINNSKVQSSVTRRLAKHMRRIPNQHTLKSITGRKCALLTMTSQNVKDKHIQYNGVCCRRH